MADNEYTKEAMEADRKEVSYFICDNNSNLENLADESRYMEWLVDSIANKRMAARTYDPYELESEELGQLINVADACQSESLALVVFNRQSVDCEYLEKFNHEGYAVTKTIELEIDEGRKWVEIKDPAGLTFCSALLCENTNRQDFVESPLVERPGPRIDPKNTHVKQLALAGEAGFIPLLEFSNDKSNTLRILDSDRIISAKENTTLKLPGSHDLHLIPNHWRNWAKTQEKIAFPNYLTSSRRQDSIRIPKEEFSRFRSPNYAAYFGVRIKTNTEGSNRGND